MENLQIWQDDSQLAQIRAQYGQGLTNNEFDLFLQIGRATNLNPYLREIYCVKYNERSPASIFIGRDGYRRSAQAHAGYQGHTVDVVYSSDFFEAMPSTGEIVHKYGKPERGVLIGSYCLVHRKNCKPMYNYVEFKEYYAGNKDENGIVKVKKGYQGKPDYPMSPTLWDSKPATMIKKVAEAQGLRGAFQELFAGTYDESEQWQDADVTKSNANASKNVVNVVEVPNTPVEIENAPQAKKNIVLHKAMHATWNDYVKIANISKQNAEATRLATVKKHYNVDSSLEMTDEQIKDFCDRLKVKIKELESVKPVEAIDTVEIAKQIFA